MASLRGFVSGTRQTLSSFTLQFIENEMQW